MKFIKYFLLLCTFGVMVASCAGGSDTTPRTSDINAYGHLQSVSSKTNEWQLADLQTYANTDGICPGLANMPYIAGLVPKNSDPSLAPLIKGIFTYVAGKSCQANNDYIKNNSSLFGNINLSTLVSTNSKVLGITGVKGYQIIYNTPNQPRMFAGASPENEIVSGLVLIPQMADMSKIKGILLYYHPTTLSKFEVPSNFDVVSSTDEMLASIYAANGYIVVAPDYVGLGVNNQVVHPYVLYPKPNALSGIYMLTAVRQFLANNAINIPQTRNLNLYISSYSEGGAYALWASRLIQGEYGEVVANDHLNLKRTVGISGAYDLTGAMIPFAFANVINSDDPNVNIFNASPGNTSFGLEKLPKLDGYSIEQTLEAIAHANAKFSLATSKPMLGSYILTSFIQYNYDGNWAAYKQDTQPPQFFQMTACFNSSSLGVTLPETSGDLNGYLLKVTGSLTTNCPIPENLPALFNDPKLSNSQIGAQLFMSAVGATMGNQPDDRNYFFNGELINGKPLLQLLSDLGGDKFNNNSVGAIINDLIPSDPTIKPYFEAANTYQFTTNSPISLVYLDYDSTVTNLDSIHACASYGVKGSSQEGLVNCLHIDNKKLYYGDSTIPALLTSAGQKVGTLPVMLDHGAGEFITNLVALHEIDSNSN
ncbi:MAG: hypothetical protein E6Q89_07070 [Bacteroidia bacterium]|nr:MAG: hypothetical protein E6Q89_07070 [Bacteroidia bacterium]